MFEDLGGKFNFLISSISSNDFLNNILSNPVYTAFLMVSIIVIGVMIMFRNTETEVSKYIIGAKLFIYLFVISSFILFINNSILIQDIKRELSTQIVPANPEKGNYNILNDFNFNEPKLGSFE